MHDNDLYHARCTNGSCLSCYIPYARVLLLITRTVSEPTHTKSKGFLIDVPFYSYTFYMHIVTYKK
jgi:hypothetical protein